MASYHLCHLYHTEKKFQDYRTVNGKRYNDEWEQTIVWINDIHHNLKLFDETLYTCVDIISQFLVKTENMLESNYFGVFMLDGHYLKLISITCLWISSKIHDVKMIDLDTFTTVSNKIFSHLDFIKTEIRILQVINFNLLIPNSLNFLQQFLKDEIVKQKEILSYYISECQLQHSDMTIFLPSFIATASICIAQKSHVVRTKHSVSIVLKKPSKTELKKKYNDTTAENCLNLIICVFKCYDNAIQNTTHEHNSIRTKYTNFFLH